MQSSLSRFAEVRRALPLVAAGLLIVVILIPMWRITLTAPQYPGQTLVVELFAYPRMGGDFMEVHALNKYVGFHYPDPVFVEPNFPIHETSVQVPEWILGPFAFVAVAAAGVFVSLAPTERKLRLGLSAQLFGTIALFTAMFVLIQVRLYQAGHSLDPHAPLSGVEEFTPPVVGSYEIANISGSAWFGPGGYLTVLAVGLLGIAFLLRHHDVTIGEVPAFLQAYTSRGFDRITTRTKSMTKRSL